MKKIILTLLAVSIIPICSYGTISLNVAATNLQNSSGTPIPVNALTLLVVASAGGEFGNFTQSAGSSLTVGSSFGSQASDVIFAVGGAPAVGTAAFAITGFTLGTFNITTNDKIILVWFPNVNSGASTPGQGQSFGTFRSDVVNPFSTIAWTIPADNSDNSITDIDPHTASQTTVPEPSSTLLVALGLSFFLRRFRR